VTINKHFRTGEGSEEQTSVVECVELGASVQERVIASLERGKRA
jgi:hypothetical protein